MKIYSRTFQAYRNAYTGLSRATWLLSLVMLINRSGTMVVPFMTLYLTSDEMGYGIADAGFVVGLFGLGAFIGAWIGGKLTDRIGFYPVQLITLAGGGTLFIVLGQMHTYPTICICMFLVSFVNEAFRPANSTAIAFYSTEGNRTRSYALNRLAINLGWALGSAMGGFIASVNYELLFWVDGITNIGAAILMWVFLKDVDRKGKSASADRPMTTASALKDRTFIWFVVAVTIFAACFFQLFTNLTVYFERNLNYSKPFIGGLMALNGIMIALIEMVLIHQLEGRRKSTTYIIGGVILVGLSYLSMNMGLSGIAVGIVMVTLITFGEILSMPFMNSFWIARTSTYNRGQYAALYTMAWSAAQTLGPVGGSQLAEHFGFATLWTVAGGLCLFAAFLFYKKTAQPSPQIP